MPWLRIPFFTVLLLAGLSPAALAQISDDVVKIGVLNDQHSVYSDIAGPGSVVAAKMAVEDVGGTVLGKPIDIIVADHENKPELGAAIARHWFNVDKVDMAIDFANSGVGLAVEQVARESNRIIIATAVAASDYTGKACAPTAISWTYSSYALTTGLARAVTLKGNDSWFFITVDYAFGYSLEADATRAVQAAGGHVVGHILHPLGTTDYRPYLEKAKASGAKVIALANAGHDVVNTVKQVGQFGVGEGQTVVPLLIFINDVNSIGLQAAQGLTFLTSFYWDRTPETRAFAQRFLERQKAMPSMLQASVYSGIRHYLHAIEAAGTDDTDRVMAKMRELPVNDFYTINGHIRLDGRLLHDMYLVQVKSPAESKMPWDYYKVLDTIPGNQAFESLEAGGCPLGKRS